METKKRFVFRGGAILVAALLALPAFAAFMSREGNPDLTFSRMVEFISGGMLLGTWATFMICAFAGISPKDQPGKEKLCAVFLLVLFVLAAEHLLQFQQELVIGMSFVWALTLAGFLAGATVLSRHFISGAAPAHWESRSLYFGFGSAGAILVGLGIRFSSPLIAIAGFACCGAMFLYGWLRFDRFLEPIPVEPAPEAKT